MLKKCNLNVKKLLLKNKYILITKVKWFVVHTLKIVKRMVKMGFIIQMSVTVLDMTKLLNIFKIKKIMEKVMHLKYLIVLKNKSN